MQLLQRQLRSRTFLLQFKEIIREFGGVIPWLEPVKDIAFATNVNWFRDRLLQGLGCEHADVITPFQLVTADPSREYLGGMMHFSRPPEQLRSGENRGIVERLTAEGAQYISCLQVRDTYRGLGHGAGIMCHALQIIRKRYGTVWGVVSEPRVFHWHVALGAHAHSSPITNTEGLGILSWS